MRFRDCISPRMDRCIRLALSPAGAALLFLITLSCLLFLLMQPPTPSARLVASLYSSFLAIYLGAYWGSRWATRQRTYVRIEYRGGGWCLCEPGQIADATGEWDYKFTEVRMTEAEFKALPEFNGVWATDYRASVSTTTTEP